VKSLNLVSSLVDHVAVLGHSLILLVTLLQPILPVVDWDFIALTLLVLPMFLEIGVPVTHIVKTTD
jgi:hypothetical protein